MKKWKSILLERLFPVLLFAMNSYGFAQENSDLKHTLSLASYYSSGSYGEDTDTDILYLPLSFGANYGKWGMQISVPHLRVDGVGNVLVNVGGINRAVVGREIERNSGIGDSVLSVTYQAEPVSDNSLFIDFRLDVKIPTADEARGLGTGEADYSAQVDISQYYGNSVLFGTFGVTFRGDTDLYAGLTDSAYVQLGVARPLAPRWNVGIFYDFRGPASTFSPEIHELVPYFSFQFSDNWSFTGLTAFGFTHASAKAAILGQISYSW